MARFGTALFGSGRFGVEELSESELALLDSLRQAFLKTLGDAVSVSDSVRKGQGKASSDTAVVADSSWQGFARDWEDALTLVEAIARLAVARGIDASPLADDSLVSAQKALNEAIAMADSFKAWPRPKATEHPALADGVTRLTAKGFNDLLSLADGVLTEADFAMLVEDVSALAEAVQKSDGILRADSGLLLDLAVAAMGKSPATDTAGTTDATGLHVARAIANLSIVLDDIVNLAMARHTAEIIVPAVDAAAAAVAKAAALSLGLADYPALSVSRVNTDSAAVAESSCVAAVVGRSLTLATVDTLVRSVASSLQGLLAVSDGQVVLALDMLRQAEDSLNAADSAVRCMEMVASETSSLDDQVYRDTCLAKGELAALASELGKTIAASAGHDLSDAIDESMLLEALRAGELLSPLVDSATGEVYHVLSQVFVNGTPVLTRGLRVSESDASRVSQCTFTVIDATPALIAVCGMDAEVHAYVSQDGEDILWGGRIVANPASSVGTRCREIQVTAQGYGARAQVQLMSGAWAATRYVDIVRALWEQTPIEPDMVLDIADDPKTVDKWVVKWQSLAAATDDIAKILGWTWRIDWDGKQKIFRFFDPVTEVHPRALSVANRNIAAGTAQFGQSGTIVNSVYVLGGQRENLDGSTTPVRVHLDELASIAIYGRHDQVVNDSKIGDPTQARESARKILRDSAWPQDDGRMEIYEPGLRAGKLVPVVLPDRNIDGIYRVAEISWWIDRTIVQREVALTRVADSGATVAQIISDLAKRVAALETEKDADDSVIDRFINQRQGLGLVANGSWEGRIGPSTIEGQATCQDTHVRASQSATAGISAWADGYGVGFTDTSRVHSGVGYTDTAASGYHAKISTTQFGFARFGEARAGTEVHG